MTSFTPTSRTLTPVSPELSSLFSPGELSVGDVRGQWDLADRQSVLLLLDRLLIELVERGLSSLAP